MPPERGTDYMTLNLGETSLNGENNTSTNPLLPASALPRITSGEIRRIAEWRPDRPSSPKKTEDAQAALEARRRRAGGDVSLAENDYRDGYRSWRLGLASGAVTTSSGAAGCHEEVRRLAAASREAGSRGTLPFPVVLEPEAQRGTTRYWWRYTMAYWVACTFIIGSSLFTFGAGFDYLMPKAPIPEDRLRIRKSATVLWPYFVGGLFFIVGGYLGYYEAINLGRGEDQRDQLRNFVWPSRVGGAWALDIDDRVWHSHWGYMAYSVGAVWFQLGIGVQLLVENGVVPSGDAASACAWVYFASAFGGGVLFCVGAALAVDHNESWRLGRAAEELVWWVANLNFVGSLLFLVGGVFIAPGAARAAGSDARTLVQLPYFVGSFMFLASSTLELFMWRIELHGLAFVRAINAKTHLRESLGDRAAAHEGDSSGVSLNQLAFVLVVVCTFSFSLMDIVFAIHLTQCRNQHHVFAYYDIYDSGLQSVLCFAALVLASVVHTIPKQRPFGMLLWLLRAVMGLLLLRYALKFALSWNESRRCRHFAAEYNDDGGDDALGFWW